MNMRWAWTLSVLSPLALALIAGSALAQGGAASPVGGAAGFGPPQGAMAIDPAALAAMQAQAYGQFAAAQHAGIPAMYPPQAIVPQQSMAVSASGRPTMTVYMPAAAAPPAAMYQQAPMYPPTVMQTAYIGGQAIGEGVQPQMPAQLPAGPVPDAFGSYGYAPSESGAPGYGQGYSGFGTPMAPLYDQGGYGGSMYDGQTSMGGACPYCGGQGCDYCGGMLGHGGIFGHGGHHGDGTFLPNGLLGDVLGLVAPYPDGGCAAVRWYDFAVDYMMLKRDNTGRSDQVFSTFGINGVPALTANQLDFGGYRPGFRFSGAVQLGPANSVEFTYFGQFTYDTAATVRSPGANLFSVFSNFGLIGIGTGGIAEFDQANFNQIRYISSFDSFEVNWRCRWMAPNCRYQGSWTAGARHFILDEKFRLSTASGPNGFATPTGFEPARSRVDTDTTNNLTGIQFGTDLWVCLLPGLRAGGELQAGVYGNHMNINTTIGSNLITANNVPPGVSPIIRQNLNSNDVSFIGQANLLATYRINYQWTLRGGYTFLYVDGVALAVENFNPFPINIANPFAPRPAIVNDNGSAFYHGWNVGLEFMW